MEGKRAQEFIYKKSVELGLFDLADHIKNVGTLKIQLSPQKFQWVFFLIKELMEIIQLYNHPQILFLLH